MKVRDLSLTDVQKIFTLLPMIKHIRVCSPVIFITSIIFLLEVLLFWRWSIVAGGWAAERNWLYFDSDWYDKIARLGYTWSNNTIQSPIVFFPFYPLAIRGVMELTGLNSVVSGFLTSVLSFASAAGLLFYLVKKDVNKTVAFWTLAVLFSFPTGIFYLLVYSESLFFLLICASSFFYQRRKYTLAFLLAGLSTGVRPFGAFFSLSLCVTFWFPKIGSAISLLFTPGLGIVQGVKRIFQVKSFAYFVLTLTLSLNGILGFMAFQQVKFGKATLFVEGQKAWYPSQPDLVKFFTLYHPIHALKIGKRKYFGQIHLWSNDVATYNSIIFWVTLLSLLVMIPVGIPVYLWLYTIFVLAIPLYATSGHTDSNVAMGSMGRYLLQSPAIMMTWGYLGAKNKWFRVGGLLIFPALYYFYSYQYIQGKWAG